MPVKCHSCGEPFENYRDLALHILAQKKGHRKGKIWAARYISLNKLSLEKRSGRKQYHTEITEEDRMNRLSTVRELSGKSEITMAVCPHCKLKHPQNLPVEHTNSILAWRINGGLAVLCASCKGVR